MSIVSVVVGRNNPTRDRNYDDNGTRYNALEPLTFATQEAPRPGFETDFAGVGRDALHTSPRQWVHVETHVQEVTGHMVNDFTFTPALRVPGALVVTQAGGAGQNPTVPRLNIDSRGNVPYGSVAVLATTATVPVEYLKLV